MCLNEDGESVGIMNSQNFLFEKIVALLAWRCWRVK